MNDTETSAYEIQEAAWAAFDAWVKAQDEDVQELSLLEQIELYAKATEDTP